MFAGYFVYTPVVRNYINMDCSIFTSKCLLLYQFFVLFFFFELLKKQKLRLAIWITHALSFCNSVLILAHPSHACPPLPRLIIISISMYYVYFKSQPSEVPFLPKCFPWVLRLAILLPSCAHSIWNLWHLSSFTLCFYKPSYSELLGSRIYVFSIFSSLSELHTKSLIRNELIDWSVIFW